MAYYDPNDDLREKEIDGRYAAAPIAGSTYHTLDARKRLMWEKDCDIAVSIGLTAMRTIQRFSSPGSAFFARSQWAFDAASTDTGSL